MEGGGEDFGGGVRGGGRDQVGGRRGILGGGKV